MFYLNEVRFLGRAVKDVELKSVGESRVATFRLVSNRRIKKRDGTYDEKATYIDCEVWNQRADYASQYVKKGTPVMVRGQLETDEWTSKEGQKRSKLKIYASEIQAERPRQDKPGEDANQDAGQGQAQPDSAPASAPANAGGSDLPF